MNFIEEMSFDKLLIFLGENYYNVMATFVIFILFYLLRKEYKRESNIIESIDEASFIFNKLTLNSKMDLLELFEESKKETTKAMNTEINTYMINLKKQMDYIFGIYKTSIKEHELKRIEIANNDIIKPAKEIAKRIGSLSSDVAKVYNSINRANEQINAVYSKQYKLETALSRKDKKISSLKNTISQLEETIKKET